MVSETHYLFVVIALLAAAVIIVTTFRSVKISPVLGYFVAGAAIGKYGFGLVIPGTGIELFGEIGIVFLMFVIGLELTLDRLMSMRRHVFGFGGTQVILTSLIVAAIFHYIFKIDLKSAIILGGGLALSSTAIIMQILVESSTQSTQVGRLSIAVLLMQDFAVVPLLVLLPILGGAGSNSTTEIMQSLGIALGKAILALGAIFILGRLLLKPFFRIIAGLKSEEIFISATLLIVLGAAYITEVLHLSMALGAFVAGLMVAETEYAHDVEDVVLPFKSLLLGLFFMTVGMSIDFHLLLANIGIILLYAALIITLKAAIVYGLCRLFRFKNHSSIQAGLLLAQGSEFAFILFGLAAENKIMDYAFAQIMMMVITVTMAMTPLLAILGQFIVNRQEPEIMSEEDYIERETSDIAGHVIIIGFGNTGKVLANILISEYIYYVAIDINQTLVTKEKENGYTVYRGDATKIDIFQHIGIERASNVVIALPNMITAKKVASLIKANYPDLRITAKSYDLEDSSELTKSGIDDIVPENYEVSIMLASSVMYAAGFSDAEVESTQDRLRFSGYKIIRQNFIEDNE